MPARQTSSCGPAALRVACGLALALAALPALAQPGTARKGEYDNRRTSTVGGEDQSLEFGGEQAAQAGLVRRAGEAPEGADAPAPADDEPVSFDAFAEPVDIVELVNLVASILELNISIDPDLSGTVVFNRSVAVRRGELLALLDAMLEQQGYTITRDQASGFLLIKKLAEVPAVASGDLLTLKVIRTPFVRPSAFQQAIALVSQASIAYIDELGVMIVKAPQREIDRIETVVEQILEERTARQRYLIELTHVSSIVARQRAIALAGGGSGQPSIPGQTDPRQQIQNRINLNNQADPSSLLGPNAAVSLDNLAERLAISPSGNALFFTGTQEEFDEVVRLVELIDTPDTLAPKKYYAGESAQQIADIGRQRGLGEVIFIEDESGLGQDVQNFRQLQQFNNQGLGGVGSTAGDPAGVGGPLMVVYERDGSILYYATPAQHDALDRLITELDTESDRIVYRTYKLNNTVAEDVAAILESLITGQSQTGQSALLPTGQGAAQRPQTQNLSAALQSGVDDGEIGVFDPADVFVVADAALNQLVVRAPLRAQDDVSRLVEQLDKRRPQVYIEALIVSVADNTDFQLAIESQILGSEYGVQSNFGLTTPGGTADGDTAGSFLSPRTVATGLGGFTAAVIQSNYVPFVVNALQTDTDSRVLSTPQILVNDNEEASIVSLEEQPTTTTQTGQTTDTTAFGGFQEAGTRLIVTPTISEAGFLRLQYEVELSSFVGTGSAGLPAPRTTQTVTGLATIPSDATIVIGGITVESFQKSVTKIPLLGDIPLLGLLFSDTGEIKTDSTLYVFITPRIMTDENFRDLKLLTTGPQADVETDQDVPLLRPAPVDVVRPRRGPAPTRSPAFENPDTTHGPGAAGSN